MGKRRESRFLAAHGTTGEGRAAGSEVAGTVLDRALRKREHARLFGLLAGDGLAFFPAGGGAAGMFSTLLTIYPLKQDVEQEVAAENAKR
jgi:hypothetical protein